MTNQTQHQLTFSEKRLSFEQSAPTSKFAHRFYRPQFVTSTRGINCLLGKHDLENILWIFESSSHARQIILESVLFLLYIPWSVFSPYHQVGGVKKSFSPLWSLNHLVRHRFVYYYLKLFLTNPIQYLRNQLIEKGTESYLTTVSGLLAVLTT